MTKKTLVLLGVILVAGAFLVGACGKKEHAPGVQTEHDHEAEHPGESIKSKAEVWTCSMHPQISEPKPGKCSLCGMNLILKKSETETKEEDHSGHDHGTMHKSMEEKPAQKAAFVQTECPVMGGKINKSLFVVHEGRKIYFCCAGCPEAFKKDPAKYMAKLK